ncbi:hypothetical protein [Salinarimonas soli]|nr:hypothetical protein [Salinarimonas soli]
MTDLIVKLLIIYSTALAAFALAGGEWAQATFFLVVGLWALSA